MSDLAHVSHDELIAEVQRRLDRGFFGYAGLFSSQQLHYRDCWHQLLLTIAEASLEAFDQLQIKRIRERAWELAGTSDAVPFRVFGLNTTLLGVQAPEAHQAEWLRAAERDEAA